MMIDDFTLIKCIGKGAFGEVFISSKQGTSQLFAIKKVPKSKADSSAIKKYFINEITILREISHPYIIHFEAIKHTIHNYYIITEYCNGGDLLSCLKKYKNLYYYPFSEEIVQHLMRQIVSAMKYLHQKRIIHRDLKLENILVIFENDSDKAKMNMLKAKIKIIDFGFATHLGASNLRYSTLGSPINMDPLLLKKLVHKNKGNMNLIGYDEKADIWSLGTVCYELLIGKEVFNAQTMIDLIRNVENGNYHVPTNLSKEVVSFLNGMLQYSAKNRLSSEELSKHPFLIKSVKDFKKLDLRKVSHKVDMQGLNINIKRNQSIWAIFNEEDEKALIDIPGKIYEESPVQLDELLGIKDLVNNNQTNNNNPFNKPINININNKMKNNTTNNQVNVVKNKEQNIDYNLLQKQQKMYHEINLKNDKFKRYANYAYNNPYGFGGTNNNNNNNPYANVQPKYYTATVNVPNNNYSNKQVQKDTTKINVPLNNNVNNIKKQIPQNNKTPVQYPQYQQYPYTTQSPYYQTNAPKIYTAPVKSQQDLINQGFYQTSPNQNTNKQNIQVKQVNLPQNNYPYNTNQVQQIQNIEVQNPVIIPEDRKKNKSPKDKLNTSKISAITTITTKTVQMPKGARMPKSYYDNYSYNNKNQQPQIIQKNPHSKSPIKQNNINIDKKNLYQKQMTYTERPKDINNFNNQNIKTNNNVFKNQGGAYNFHSVKVIQKIDKIEKPNNNAITVTINNKVKKPTEGYTIKYENKDFPENNYSPQVKITKIESTKDIYPSPSDFKHSHKKSADYLVNNNNDNIKKEENNIIFNNDKKKEHKKRMRNDSFPMPETDEEEEKEKSNESKNDEDSENLDDLIEFKLGDEICPPEDEIIDNDIKDDNDKEKEENFEMTMKKKIMERTVERPTLGVPPPGTDPKDNYEFDEDDDLNNGVFQTNKNNVFNNDNNNFEI